MMAARTVGIDKTTLLRCRHVPQLKPVFANSQEITVITGILLINFCVSVTDNKIKKSLSGDDDAGGASWK